MNNGYDRRTGQVHPMNSGITTTVSDTGRNDPSHKLRALMQTNPQLQNDPEVLAVMDKWYNLYQSGQNVDAADVMTEIVGKLLVRGQVRSAPTTPAPWRQPNQPQGMANPYTQQHSVEELPPYGPLNGVPNQGRQQQAPLPMNHPEADYDPLLFNDTGDTKVLPQGMTYQPIHNKHKIKLALRTLFEINGVEDNLQYYSRVNDIAEEMGAEGLEAFKDFKCNQRKDGKLPGASVLYQEALDIISEAMCK